MDSKRFKYTFFTILFLCLAMAAPPAIAEIVFIGNMRSVPDELTIEDIESIFLGKKISWHDKTPVKMVLLTKAGVLDAFTREYTKKPKHLFKRHWRRLVFSGTGQAPKGFKTTEDVIDYVVKTKGAIGFVLSDTKIENVKIINITDGRKK